MKPTSLFIAWKQARDLADVLAAEPDNLEGNLAGAFLAQAALIREMADAIEGAMNTLESESRPEYIAKLRALLARAQGQMNTK